MADRKLTNATPFAAQELFLADEEGRDLLVIVVKGTYVIPRRGHVVVAEEQVPVEMAGKHHGEPGKSSVRFEPEVAPLKLATDLVLVGHAWADRPGARYVDVGLECGPVRKVIRVFGNRWWFKRAGFETISEPQPFERVPLAYERAFGGWDRTPEDPASHTVERRNPVGVGYHHPRKSRFVDEQSVPNVEQPGQLIRGYSDAPPPAGFGFVGHDWVPRAQHTGTYDEAWSKTRMPLLPTDFDRRFHNAAPADQIIPTGYLRGDEPVRVANVSADGGMEFYLPAEPPPVCTIATGPAPKETRMTQLDTIIIDADASRLLLLWRTQFRIPRGVHDVRAMSVELHPASVLSRTYAHSTPAVA